MGIDLNNAKSVVRDFVENGVFEEGGVDFRSLAKGVVQFSDEELRLTAMMEGNTSSEEWRIAIALAKSELDRRAQAATEVLLMKTTNRAAWAGIIGACLGGALGAGATMLVFLLST
ncbi:hypothetical protein [Marinibacterium sp. SX1]|uniref:hypothetical protein n=1 Tax=Marinibacterium sp. SX1 TaxID=3388424 RepID=UPI003D17C423